MDIDSIIYPPGLCPRISFIIDQVYRSQHPCDYCDKEMLPGDLRVQQRSKSYHLACYRPDIRMRIEQQNVKNHAQNEEKKQFELWLSRYNEAFRTVGTGEAQKWKVRLLGRYGKRRELVEALKYLSARELACTVSLVSKDWRAQSLDTEIWTSLIHLSYPGTPSLPYHPRICYQYLYLSCCYGCSCLFPPCSEVLTKHPVTCQPLCKDCFPKQFFNPVMVENYCVYLGINRDYIRSANVRTFMLGSKFSLMPYEAKRKIVALRKRRMEALCARMRNTQTAEYLSTIDVETTYKKKDVDNLLKKTPNLSISAALNHLFFAVECSALVLKRPSTCHIPALKRPKLG